MSVDLIRSLTALVTENARPDITILIDIDPILARKRMNTRTETEEDQFDLGAIRFQEKVREGFLYCAKTDPDRIKIIDGTSTEDNIHDQIISILSVCNCLGGGT